MQYIFENKYLINSALETREYYHVSNYSIVKEIWDTLKLIHEDIIKIKGAKMKLFNKKFELLENS